MLANKKPQIVVLGAGFGGLTFCQTFAGGADITVVDRTNHHLFQPLLYQVAAAGLSAPEIAQPIRAILSKHRNVTVLLDTVTDINLTKKEVALESKILPYDYLVLALGGRTSYFGHPEWEQHAPGLKSLNDALQIRSRILAAFERAENTTEAADHDQLMTIVIVGGGPTGVELAGAFAELARTVLAKDFRRIDPTHARIVLIEASPVVLSHLPEDLASSATQTLKNMGVQVRTSVRVKEIRHGEVELETGEVIRAANILWAAGVAASPLTAKLGVELDRAGRIKVQPDLTLPGHPEVFAIGDLVSLLQADGKPVPGVSPAAMQMARYAAHTIEANLKDAQAERPPFRYHDKGTMATIGRSAAVAMIGKFKFTGWFAWLTWLFVHLIFLVGFRNRVAVLFQWAYSYITYKRSARIIVTNPPT